MISDLYLGSRNTSNERPGFALVISISLMAFILMLLLSLTAIVQMELQQADNSTRMELARQNAKYGVTVALGQLQKYVGPDTRTTAKASLLDSDPTTLAIEGVLNPHWMAVWDSQDRTHLPMYLVSGNGDYTFSDNPSDYPSDFLDATTTNLWTSTYDDTRVPIVNNAVNQVASEVVNVVKVPVGSEGGNYGYWVGDESVKARANLEDLRHSGTSSEDELLQLLAPKRYGLELSHPDFAGLESINTEELDLAFFPDDLSLVTGAPTAFGDSQFGNFFHTVSMSSRGVQANQRIGGLKQDLTWLLGTNQFGTTYTNDPSSYMIADQHTAGHYHGPRWQHLQAYHNLAANVSVGGSMHDWTDDSMDPSAAFDASSNEYGHTVHPMILSFRQGIGMTFEVPAAATPHTYDIFFHLRPVVVMANPYSVRLNAHDYRLNIEFVAWNQGRVGLFVNDRDTIYCPIKLDHRDYGMHNITYIIRCPAMEPGEVKTFTLGATANFQLYPNTGNFAGINFNGQQYVYLYGQSGNQMATTVDLVDVTGASGVGVMKNTLKFDTGVQLAKADTNGDTVINGSDQFEVQAHSLTNAFKNIGGPTTTVVNQLAIGTHKINECEIKFSDASGNILQRSRYPAWSLHSNFYDWEVPNDSQFTIPGYSDVDISTTSGTSLNPFFDAHGYYMRLMNPFDAYTNRYETTDGGYNNNLIRAEFNGSRLYATRNIRSPLMHTVRKYQRRVAGENVENLFTTQGMGNNRYITNDQLSSNGAYHYSVGTGWGDYMAGQMNPLDPLIIQGRIPVNPEQFWRSMDPTSPSMPWFSFDADDGAVDKLVMFDVPRLTEVSDAAGTSYGIVNLASIGALQHFNFGIPHVENPTGLTSDDVYGDLYNSYWKNDASMQSYASRMSHMLSSTYSIGNSYALPFIPRESTLDEFVWSGAGTDNYERYYDYSYLLNQLLFDGYFFSTIPQAQGGLSATAPMDEMALLNQRHITYDDPALNENYGDYWGQTAADTAHQPFAAAQRLFVDGAFNVNSTDVRAWAAFLGSLNGSDYAGDANRTAPFARTHNQDGELSGSLDETDDEFWSGYHNLSASEIYDDNGTPNVLADDSGLAVSIVEEVKARGPFLSLSDFVNRRLIANNQTGAESGIMGALQAAIDKSGVNDLPSDWDLDLTTTANGSSPTTPWGDVEVMIRYDEMEHAEGNIADLSTGALSQADILQTLAPGMLARGDTFMIRAYGDAVNPVSEVVEAKAVCEVIVQRTPTPVEPDSANNRPYDPVIYNPGTSSEYSWGREFRVVSFRWLDEADI